MRCLWDNLWSTSRSAARTEHVRLSFIQNFSVGTPCPRYPFGTRQDDRPHCGDNPMSIHPITILIGEDHTIVREGLVSLINYQDDMTVVAQAGNGVEVVRQFQAHQPDVTLIDLVMPEMSGVEAIRVLSAQYPHARFVVLTTYDGDEDIYRALEA